MELEDVFDPYHPERTADEWREILRWAVGLLVNDLGVPARVGAFTLQPFQIESASFDNGVDVSFEARKNEAFYFCGYVSALQEFGEGVWIEAQLLAFAQGNRVPGHARQKLVYRLTKTGPHTAKWVSAGWVADEWGEWDSYSEDSRWRTA